MTIRSIILNSLALGGAGVLLSGCLAMTVAGAAVGVAGTAVGMTAKGVGAVVGAVIPDGKKKDDQGR